MKWILAAIPAYHLLCGVFVWRSRDRVRASLRQSRWGIAAGLTLVFAAALAAAPSLRDPRPYRDVFRAVIPPSMFEVFALYTMLVHVPLEELFWRGVLMDPRTSSPGRAVPAQGLFFYVFHAVPMALLLGSEGVLLALPTGAAGAAWAFVAIRSRSLWPGLVSHWGADGLILAGMWFYFIR